MKHEILNSKILKKTKIKAKSTIPTSNYLFLIQWKLSMCFKKKTCHITKKKRTRFFIKKDFFYAKKGKFDA